MKGLIAALCISASTLVRAAPSEGDPLLDKLISDPGSYSLFCGLILCRADVPYNAYHLTEIGGVSFSSENLAVMSSNRALLVPAVRQRLKEIDFSHTPVSPAEDMTLMPQLQDSNRGCDPRSLNPLLLNLILNLQAIEVLPELLSLEQRLLDATAAAEVNDTVPVPQIHRWYACASVRGEELTGTWEQQQRQRALFNARIAQRDLLMLIQMMMREKQYAPALNTYVEKAYVAKLNAAAKEDSDRISQNSPQPEDKAQATASRDIWDEFMPGLIPYTSESRQEIRAAAGQWIKEHP